MDRLDRAYLCYATMTVISGVLLFGSLIQAWDFKFAYCVFPVIRSLEALIDIHFLFNGDEE